MKTFIAALALAGLVSFPAFAQSFDPAVGSGNIAPNYAAPAYETVQRDARSPAAAFASVTPFGTPGLNHGAQARGSDRASSIRECSGLAAPYRQTTWGNMDSHLFRSCMASHGQPE